MNDREELKRLLNLEIDNFEFFKLIDKLMDNGNNPKIKELKADMKSQDRYIAKYKHLDILEYDPETFLPIYKGIRKWSKNI
jgi:hypothetical protein